MKQITIILFTSFFMLSLFSACGPSEEEVRQQEQARQDSLERAQQQQSQQQQDTTMSQQMQQDTATASGETSAEAEQEATEEEKKKETPEYNFNENGSLAIQVEAWRSRDKAEAQVSKWVNRGFENAYVVMHGNKDTGDIWFRVRLGRAATKDAAEQIGTNIQESFNSPYWIANVQEKESGSDSSNGNSE